MTLEEMAMAIEELRTRFLFDEEETADALQIVTTAQSITLRKIPRAVRGTTLPSSHRGA